MSDCPPDAIHRGPDGEVFIDDTCIGCGNCQRYCPYGVIRMDKEPPKKPSLLNWLFFGEATLTFPQTIYFRYSQLEPDDKKNPQAAADYARWFLARLRALETAVSQSETVCAGRFTAADISVGYALMFAQSNGLSAQFTPAVAAYWERLKQREGFRKAIAAQDRASAEQGVAPRVPAAT